MRVEYHCNMQRDGFAKIWLGLPFHFVLLDILTRQYLVAVVDKRSAAYQKPQNIDRSAFFGDRVLR